MIKRARDNAKKENLRPPNVAFIQTHLTEPLPIASDSVDCVLSNCVINLLPLDGKAGLLKEVYRVLKPGGRVYFDDVRGQNNFRHMHFIQHTSDHCEAETAGCYTQRFGVLRWLHFWCNSNR